MPSLGALTPACAPRGSPARVPASAVARVSTACAFWRRPPRSPHALLPAWCAARVGVWAERPAQRPRGGAATVWFGGGCATAGPTARGAARRPPGPRPQVDGRRTGCDPPAAARGDPPAAGRASAAHRSPRARRVRLDARPRGTAAAPTGRQDPHRRAGRRSPASATRSAAGRSGGGDHPPAAATGGSVECRRGAGRWWGCVRGRPSERCRGWVPPPVWSTVRGRRPPATGSSWAAGGRPGRPPRGRSGEGG